MYNIRKFYDLNIAVMYTTALSGNNFLSRKKLHCFRILFLIADYFLVISKDISYR